ncbi:unnamed protein product [Parajaminaea phylloscopi]
MSSESVLRPTPTTSAISATINKRNHEYYMRNVENKHKEAKSLRLKARRKITRPTDEQRAHDRAYYRRNPRKMRESRHKEEIKMRNRRYRENNAEQADGHMRRWQELNKDAVKARRLQREAERLGGREAQEVRALARQRRGLVAEQRALARELRELQRQRRILLRVEKTRTEGQKLRARVRAAPAQRNEYLIKLGQRRWYQRRKSMMRKRKP